MAHRFFRSRRLALEVRQRISARHRIVAIGLSLVLGLGISMAILVGAGVSPGSIYDEFIAFTFFNASGIANVIIEATPLVLVGLGAAVAFRVNYWNIGIEGQFFAGVIGATIVAIFDVGPPWLRLPLMLLFGFGFGALWAVPPMLLKMKLNVSEVITTLLFNYLAFYFVLNQVYGAWKDPASGFPHSQQYDEGSERLPLIGWEQVHYGIVIAAAAVIVVWWLVERSRFGIQSRFVGMNPRMALAIGLPVSGIMATSALLSGALAGGAGVVMAAASEFRLTPSIAAGYGFSGVVIAFLAGNRPVATLAVAFLMGGLYTAGESVKVFYGLPAAMVGLIQAIIVLFVASAEFFVRYRIRVGRYEGA